MQLYISSIVYIHPTTNMSTPIVLLAQRIDVLEKQMAVLMSDNTNHSIKTDKKEKKEKKQKKEKKEKKDKGSDSDDQPKKKRTSGYILFGKAERDNVKAELEAEADADADSKVKSTDVMKRLGELWKQLPEATRDEWNAKAKELTEA